MRLVLLTAGFIFISILGMAQDKIVAIPSANGPVLEHKVAPKESLYALSRKYNVKVAEIAAANGFEMSKSLVIGETVKIPLVASNFNQKDKKGTPVYYTAGDGEGLLSVSKKFNKIPLKTIKDFNGLKTDAAPKDKPIIVGYLSGTQIKSEAKTEAVKKDEKPAAKPEDKKAETAKKQEKPADKKEVKKETIKAEKQPEKRAEEKVVEKAEPAPAPKVQEVVIDESGFFKNAFAKNTNPSLLTNRTLMSGIFKTDAGWSDKKFYMLMDGIAPGTIVKVTNPQNGKFVYAKVLGSMRDVKYSEGLNMRISEAATTVMQISGHEQFVVNVSY